MSNENLFYNIFPLKNEVNENDAHREGSLLFEYFQATITVATNLGEVEVPTNLDEVLGVLSIGFMSTFAAGDTAHGLSTDGVITTGAVTVRGTTVSLADGTYTIRGFLIGKRGPAAVSVS